ncbi:hypothetical protein NQ317_003172 [Molorchus minor]|uniref:C2H2-type domain-containing protein n=1 Tax=Molorchus minor TaxID=1323400 RepID=A0ABQ9JCL4_9CUCU|nr:hypothetical protein NQ317_003172 [Molorchus minor]
MLKSSQTINSNVVMLCGYEKQDAMALFGSKIFGQFHLKEFRLSSIYLSIMENLIKVEEEAVEDVAEYVDVDQMIKDFKQEPPVNTAITESNQTFVCSQCSRKYKKLEYLQLHEYIHDPQKKCPFECNQIFDKQSFKKHMNGHIKEKMEEEKKRLAYCNICKRSFRTVRQGTLHAFVHTDERPHVCHVCGKSFKRKAGLNEHSIFHEKPKLACPKCPLKFIIQSTLKRHIKNIHEKDKQYPCKICNENFLGRKILWDHVKNQHPGHIKLRKCMHCPLVFKSPSKLAEHYKMLHKNVDEFRFVCILCGQRFFL